MERQKGKRAELEARIAELEEQQENNKQEATRYEHSLRRGSKLASKKLVKQIGKKIATSSR